MPVPNLIQLVKPLVLNDAKTPAFVPTRSKSLGAPAMNSVVLKIPAPNSARLPVMSVQLAPAPVVRVEHNIADSTSAGRERRSGRQIGASCGSQKHRGTGADINDILVVYPT